MSTPDLKFKGPLLDMEPEEAWKAREKRVVNDANLRDNDSLPKFGDDPAQLHERLISTEFELVPRGDYNRGIADADDDILTILGNNGMLLTAEHATGHIRRSRKDGLTYKKVADEGTGALASVVALDTNNRALIMCGRQTGDANYDEVHPFKDEMAEVITLPVLQAHLSVHGIMRAHSDEIKARNGLSVILGIGNKPSEATMALKDRMREIGSDMGLRVGVNSSVIGFDTEAKKPYMFDDRAVKMRIFSAPEFTTRGWAQTVASKHGKDDSFATIQVELSDVLRVHPASIDQFYFPSQRDREIGAYLGYHFLLNSVQAAVILNG